MEYFEGALDYLLDHPKIYSKNGTGITGVSKGGENAMAMGAFLPESKIAALEILVAPLQYIGAQMTYKNETVLDGKTFSIIYYLKSKYVVTKKNKICYYYFSRTPSNS